MDQLVYLIVGMAVGAVLMWLIRKLTAEKHSVEKRLYDEKSSALMAADQRVVSLAEKATELQIQLTQKESELKTITSEREQIHIQFATAKNSLDKLQSDFLEIKNQYEDYFKQTNDLKDYVLKVKSENEVLKEKNNTIKKEIEELGDIYTNQFKNLANEILEDKSKKFAEENQKNLKQILDPLNTDIKEFKKRVEETYEKENKQRFSLEEKIKDLVQLNQRISEEANNLTRALKGQRKTQGDWGEMILENILQQSGMTEGREYAKQEFIRDSAGNTLVNEEGRKMQPDFIIYYPDKRTVIIDSKVSLSAYERYNSADDELIQKAELANHIAAIYSHIDELSRRNYQQYVNSLDFVMLFIPIEPAYMLAMQMDREMWSYAYKKRIILISPTNLIAAVKLVSELWKREEQNKNALAIAERGAILYDKFVGFVENLQIVGEAINRSQRSYDEAMKQLKEGNGNLIGQADKLRRLGVQGKKEIPSSLLNDADLEEDQ